MDLKGKYNAIFIVIGILWVALWVLAIADQYLAAFILSIVMMLLHLILGSANNEKIDKGYLIYPLLSWAVVWAIGFYLAYANDLAAQVEAGKFFGGFHYSFGPVVYLYWIGGVLTLMVGYFFNRNRWLSDEQWNEFIEEANRIKGKKGE
ncbi:MAG: hypothetical protein Q4E76_02460 [Tissierellia bacterium]|nr:hypothetical protein [Tissierellia bacterium]